MLVAYRAYLFCSYIGESIVGHSYLSSDIGLSISLVVALFVWVRVFLDTGRWIVGSAMIQDHSGMGWRFSYPGTLTSDIVLNFFGGNLFFTWSYYQRIFVPNRSIFRFCYYSP